MEHTPSYCADQTPKTVPPLSLFDKACLHEIIPADGGNGGWKQSGDTIGFTAALAARRVTTKNAPCLWVQHRSTIPDEGILFGPGLQCHGLDPEMVMIMRPAHEKDALGMMEAALESEQFAVIVGSLPGNGRFYDLTASRRLQLRAKQSRTPLCLIRHGDPAPSAALCRWQVRPAAAAPQSGQPRTHSARRSHWRIDLIRSRISPPGNWFVSWTHETHSFSCSAGSADTKAGRHAIA